MTIRYELIRKSIHLGFSIIPALYFILSKDTIVIILSVIVIMMIFIDIIRFYFKPFNRFYSGLLKPILRNHEVIKKTIVFTGGTFIVISALICILIFPKYIALTAIFIAIFSDSSAAIIGKAKGKHFILNRSIEGSIAFFVSGLIVITLIPLSTNLISEYFIRFGVLILTTLFELLPLKIDDNITIPVFFSLIYFIFLNYLF
jgi:dolichol kinase